MYFYQTGSNELLFVGHFLSGVLLLVGPCALCARSHLIHYIIINDLPNYIQSYVAGADPDLWKGGGGSKMN